MLPDNKLARLLKFADPSLKAATLLSTLAFLHVSFDYYRHDVLQIGLLFRVAATSLLLLVLLAGIFRTMVREVHAEVDRLQRSLTGEADLHALRVFAATKAIIRAMLGVSLLLGWLGGLLLIFAGVAHHGYLVAVVFAGLFSLGLFYLAMRLIDFMDHIRFPAP